MTTIRGLEIVLHVLHEAGVRGVVGMHIPPAAWKRLAAEVAPTDASFSHFEMRGPDLTVLVEPLIINLTVPA